MYLSNKETSSTNSLTWDKGATLYFSYDASKTHGNYSGVWNVVDSGAYSKIT